MLYNNKCIILKHMLVIHAVKNHFGDILFHITCTQRLHRGFSSQTLKSKCII